MLPAGYEWKRFLLALIQIDEMSNRERWTGRQHAFKGGLINLCVDSER
jgi:hypothetical protein